MAYDMLNKFCPLLSSLSAIRSFARSNMSKTSKGKDENERLRQEIERQRREIEHQRKENERLHQKNEHQREENEQLRHYLQCKISKCSTCQDIKCNDGQHVDVPCIHCGDLGSFYRGQSTLKETVDFLRDFPGKKPLVLDRDEANQWIKDVPQELWLGEIMPYFSVKELSLGGTIAKHFQKYWVTFKSKRKLCVPKDFPSLSEAVHVGEILSRRGIISSTNENVLKIMLSNGVHDENGEYVHINYPVSVIGESRENCVVMGGLLVDGGEEDDVNVTNLTLRDSKYNGVCGDESESPDYGVFGIKGASIHLDNVSVENSETHGVFVGATKRSTMKNCNVRHSKGSGLVVDGGGLMTISGNGTTIHHNCTNSVMGDDYGLDACTPSSSIHLVSSLTIETIAKNNGGGGGGENHGGYGTIKSVDT